MVALGMSADGGMADFLVADGMVCVPVGADVDPERAVLVEPFAVALHALHQVPVAGRRVAVVGIGSLGLCLVEAAVLEGAGEVVAISRSAPARGLASEGGAAATLPPDRAAEVDADVVFETAGAAPAIAASFAAVRRGGRVVVLGGHPRTSAQLLPVDVPAVQGQHPELVAFAAQQSSIADGAELYTIIKDDSTAAVTKWFADQGGSWPIVRDDNGSISTAFGVARCRRPGSSTRRASSSSATANRSRPTSWPTPSQLLRQAYG